MKFKNKKELIDHYTSLCVKEGCLPYFYREKILSDLEELEGEGYKEQYESYVRLIHDTLLKEVYVKRDKGNL